MYEEERAYGVGKDARGDSDDYKEARALRLKRYLRGFV